MTGAEPAGVELTGDRVHLKPVAPGDVDHLLDLRRSPSVYRWWGPPEQENWPFDDPSTQTRTVWSKAELIGYVQWYENDDDKYRHAGVDLFLADRAQGQGLGREVVGVVVTHLLSRGHHRVVIDPAAANRAAIACYTACGFRLVGVMHRYEKDPDGEDWHDGLLMEYVVE